MPYHAISCPISQSEGSGSNFNAEDRVFQTIEETLKALKTNKQSRFKSFEKYEDALNFAKEPYISTIEHKISTQTLENKIENVTPAPTEGCTFKGLTPQELKQLKQAIANENVELFDKLVSENPRYLTTPCDTPSILHSGTRANALHVAASESGALGKASPKMTQKVLDSILSPDLMERMYPGETAENRARRQEYLFDMYLNTPLKGTNDTPLHIAAKFGAIDVVALLVQYSSCDTKRLNKDGLTPSDIVGSRMSSKDIEVEKKIRQLLSDNLYIPIYRVCDNSQPAFVGEIWSPRKPSSLLSSEKNPQDISHHSSNESQETSSMSENLVNNNLSPSVDLDALSPIMIRQQLEGVKSSLISTDNTLQYIENEENNGETSFGSPLPSETHNITPSKKRSKSPLLVAKDRYPISPLFTPKRNIMGPPSKQSPISNNPSESVNVFDSPGFDTSSSSCRSISSPLSVQAILGPFTSVEEAKKIQQEWKKPQTKSNLLRLKDSKKGLEMEGRILASKYKSSMIEYWGFLETYCDLTTEHGLEQLDSYLHDKTECRVCISPKSHNNLETSYQQNIQNSEERINKQRQVEQDKIMQLQDVLANLHISSNTNDYCNNSTDDTATTEIPESAFNSTYETMKNIDNNKEINNDKNSSKLKLSILKEELNDAEMNSSNKNDSICTQNNPLSPTSIWSRTRESKLDLSTASSNESEENPFRFNELQQELDNMNSSMNVLTARKIEEYMSDSEDNSFHSVASSLKSSVLTADEGSNWIYLMGSTPTDTDRQVYDIIKNINVDQFPSIKTWKILMETYKVEQREQWVSYEKQIKNVESDMLSQSNVIYDVKSKLLFED